MTNGCGGYTGSDAPIALEAGTNACAGETGSGAGASGEVAVTSGLNVGEHR